MSGVPGLLTTCLVATSSGTVRFDGVGWEERVDLDLVGAHGCTHVDLTLPDGVELVEWSMTVAPVDLKRYRPGPEREVREALDEDGARTVRLLLPELEPGDKVALHLERLWTRPEDFQWSPGASGATYAELRLPKGVTPAYTGLTLDKRIAWAREPAEAARLRLPHPWAERGAPVLGPVEDGQLSAVHAHARIVTRVEPVPAAWFGRDPVVGQEALELGVADHRGIARTLVALAEGGPDVVELGRWSESADTPPVPGAFELPIHRARWGPVAMPHPLLAVPGGWYHTPSGPVRVASRPASPLSWEQRDPRDRDLVELARGTPSPEFHVQREADILVTGKRPLEQLGTPQGLDYDDVWTLTALRPDRRAVLLPLPPDARDVRIDPTAPCDRMRATEDGVWLVLPRDGAACRVRVRRPLTDVWGQGTAAKATWLRPDGVIEPGEVVVEGGTWRLVSLAGQKLLTDRDRLWNELFERYRRAAIPEPGLAATSKAGRNGWDLAEALRELVRSRVTVADLPVPATQPRPLHAARRGRAMTSAETAMLGALYARQARVVADWVLVRSEPVGVLAPIGYDTALVRLRHEGGQAWVDLDCDVCGPFEVRPELLGAEALGPDLDHVPQPVAAEGLLPGIALDGDLWRVDERALLSGVGAWAIEESEAEDGTLQVRWRLAGADALGLRRTLAEDAPAQRPSRLSFLLHARPDTAVAFEGISEGGAPIDLVAEPTALGALDPLDLDPAELGARLQVQTAWLGLRTWTRPAPVGHADGAWSCDDGKGPIGWRAVAREGVVTEQLLVRERSVSGRDVIGLAVCRGQIGR